MTGQAEFEFPLRTAGSRSGVSLRTLVLIRWVSIAGQAFVLLLVQTVLGFTRPFVLGLCIVGASALVNLLNARQRRGTVRLDDRDAFLFLTFDVLQAGALLYLTGGSTNPFSLLLLSPVTIGASILERRSLIGLAILTAIIIGLLATYHVALPWETTQQRRPPMHIAASALARIAVMTLVAAYIRSVANEHRRVSEALAAAQLSLAREQHASSVGALAASAAHELGSPLATIAVVAGELARDLPPGTPQHEDAKLLLSETARCRTILAELGGWKDADQGSPFADMPLTALVELACDSHVRDPHVPLLFETEGDPSLQPSLPRRPEIVHGLGNIIQNAAQFARTSVEITTAWDRDQIVIEVADDGPGFPPHILSRLGEPYLSSRVGDGNGHMGLGIFIAQTLLRSTGALLTFANGANVGALVRVRWQRRGPASIGGSHAGLEIEEAEV